jgi:hypothetical protein
VRPDEVELIRRDYSANGGWETFLAYEDPRQVRVRKGCCRTGDESPHGGMGRKVIVDCAAQPMGAGRRSWHTRARDRCGLVDVRVGFGGHMVQAGVIVVRGRGGRAAKLCRMWQVWTNEFVRTALAAGLAALYDI